MIIKFIKNNKIAIILGLTGILFPIAMIKFIKYQTDYLNRGVRREIYLVQSRNKKLKSKLNQEE